MVPFEELAYFSVHLTITNIYRIHLRVSRFGCVTLGTEIKGY